MAFGFLTSRKIRNAASKLGTNCKNSKVCKGDILENGVSLRHPGVRLSTSTNFVGLSTIKGNLSGVTGDISFMFTCLCILMFCLIFHPCISKHLCPGGSMCDCCVRAVSLIPSQNCSELFDLYITLCIMSNWAAQNPKCFLLPFEALLLGAV